MPSSGIFKSCSKPHITIPKEGNTTYGPFEGEYLMIHRGLIGTFPREGVSEYVVWQLLGPRDSANAFLTFTSV